MECQEHCNLKMPCVQASEAETKKYEEVQQSEQSAFQASIVDLDQAVAAMQSYTDMSAATAVAEEVTSLSRNLHHAEQGLSATYHRLMASPYAVLARCHQLSLLIPQHCSVARILRDPRHHDDSTVLPYFNERPCSGISMFNYHSLLVVASIFIVPVPYCTMPEAPD